MSTLYDATDEIDQICADELGDPIKYTPTGHVQKHIHAHVDYADAETDIGAGQLVDQQITVAVMKSDLPREPIEADRLILPRWPGKTFRPAGPSTDESGTHWRFGVKAV